MALSKENKNPRLPVFVYGTLRFGGKNFDPFLGHCWQKIMPATIRGSLYYVQGEGYPYVIDEEGLVKGELAYLRSSCYDHTLARLDLLEEYHPAAPLKSIYLRRKTTAFTAYGQVVAWAYYWNRKEMKGQRISTGDFLDLSQTPSKSSGKTTSKEEKNPFEEGAGK